MTEIAFRTKREVCSALAQLGWENPSRDYSRFQTEWGAQLKVPRLLRVNLTVFSIYISFLRSFFLLCFIDGTHAISLGKQLTYSQKSRISLMSLLCTDASSISLLCRSGFDVQAQNILRSFRERVDLLICTSLDEAIARQFVESGDLAGSRSFFFSHQSKGKMKKRAAELLSKRLSGGFDIQMLWWSGWRDELDLVLGAAEHCNHTVGMISFMPNLGFRGPKVGFGITGYPSNVSNRTLTDSMLMALEVAFLAAALRLDVEVGRLEDNDGTIKSHMKDFKRQESFVWNGTYRLLSAHT